MHVYTTEYIVMLTHLIGASELLVLVASSYLRTLCGYVRRHLGMFVIHLLHHMPIRNDYD